MWGIVTETPAHEPGSPAGAGYRLSAGFPKAPVSTFRRR
jgi:hypothetical protein